MLLLAEAAEEPTIRPDRQPTRRFLGHLLLCTIYAETKYSRPAPHVRIIKVPRRIRARGVTETKSLDHRLPAFPIDEQPVQCHVDRQIALGVNDWHGLLLAPEPAQRVGKDRSTVVGIVSVSWREIKAHVVADVFQCRVHLDRKRVV